MPWVVKDSGAAAAAASDAGEKPKPKKDKGEGKGGKAKGGDKGGKGGDKGKGKGERAGNWGYDDPHNDYSKGKKGKGKGKEEAFSDKGGKGGKGKFDDEGGKGSFSKGGKKGVKGKYESQEDDPERSERPARNEDMRRQASAHTGTNCTVRKHSSMGCAVISMNSIQTRQAILRAGLTKIEIAGHTLTVKAHSDKDTKQEIMTDLFAGWGRQAEKTDPLPEQTLADFFDDKHNEFVTTGTISMQAGAAGAGHAMSEDAKRSHAQKTAAAQAQWAASGGLAPAARPAMPPGPAPAVPPGAVPGNPQQAQQQQTQYIAAMQMQMQMRAQQQQAYYAAMQAQQHQQQQAWMAHLKAQQEAQATVTKNRQAGHKAAYRVPTDDEVRAKLMQLSSPAASGDATKPGGGEPMAPEADASVAAAPAAEA